MRKLFCLVITLTLVASILVSCGTAQPAVASATSSSPQETQPSESEAVEKVTLTLCSYMPDMRKDYELYDENMPDIDLEISIGASDFRQLIKTKVASGDSPDIYTLWPGQSFVVYYAKNGHLLDLSDREWAQHIVPGVVPTVSYEDKVYAQPSKMALVGVIYNKKIWSELNLEIPQTWEEFLDICETLKQNDIIPVGIGGKTEWAPQFLPLYTLPCNVVYSVNPSFDDQLFEGTANFSDSNYTKCFEMFMELDEKGYYPPSPLGVTYEQVQDLMVNDKIAMTIQGSWEVNELLQKKADMDVGMFPLPAPEGYTTTVPVGADLCNVISSTTKNREAALKFLDYMGSQEAYDISATLNSNISPLSNIKTNLPPAVQEMLPHTRQRNGRILFWTRCFP